MLDKTYYVYLMANDRNTVLYIGMTNDLPRRITEHKEKRGSSFCRKYNVNKLVYFEKYSDINYTIAREKQIKKYSRDRKNKLITNFNNSWKDLFNEIWDW